MDVHGRILLKCMSNRFGDVEWIGVVHNRDRRQTVVSTVMNFRVPKNSRNFVTSTVTASCQGPRSMACISQSGSNPRRAITVTM